MVETFLLADRKKEDFIRKAIITKPVILIENCRSMIPVFLWALCWSATAILVWLSGDMFARFLPLDRLPFDASDNIMQLQIVSTSVIAVIIIGAVRWHKSIKLTVTSDYISVTDTLFKPITHFVLISDIAGFKYNMGMLGAIGRFGTLKITRNDNSRVVLRAMPCSAARAIEQAQKEYVPESL